MLRGNLASRIVWLTIFIVGRDNSLAAVLTIRAGMLSWPADFVPSREFNNFKMASSSTSLKWKTSWGKFCVFILTILSWLSYFENTSCRRVSAQSGGIPHLSSASAPTCPLITHYACYYVKYTFLYCICVLCLCTYEIVLFQSSKYNSFKSIESVKTTSI